MNAMRTLLVGMLLLSLVVVAAPSFAAGASAGAGATIASGISCAKITGADLEFGVIIPDTAASTVIVSPAGVRTKTGNCTLLSINPLPQAAAFSVGGTANATYAFTVTEESITVTSGSHTMTVDTWTTDPSGSSSFVIGSAGTQDVKVGGTLKVGANQAAGRYTGTFNVTANYN